MSSPRNPRGETGGRPRALRAAIAALGLVALLGGLGLPLVGLVVADEPAPFCGAKGCGCGHEDAAVAGAPLQIEAVLPAMRPPARAEPHLLLSAGAAGGEVP